MVKHVTFTKDGIVWVAVKCILCGQTLQFGVPVAEYDAWTSGTLIHNAMPSVPESYREILISETCGDCFEEMFPVEEDEDVVQSTVTGE